MLNPFAVSGGAGGVDLSGGPATAGVGDTGGSAGGQVFNFLPPQSIQQKAVSTPVVLGVLALGALWLYTRRK
ncbi:hypothetical protein [Marinobacter sp. LN3S78]|uniref:hypothetical protein n=1 Tax=Marinobacter sp. LN3S78 TaxID=3382300 RepID=UPI00387B531D